MGGQVVASLTSLWAGIPRNGAGVAVPLIAVRRWGRRINDRMHAIGKPAPAPELVHIISTPSRSGWRSRRYNIGRKVGTGLNQIAPLKEDHREARV
jgi:hypothetical protein